MKKINMEDVSFQLTGALACRRYSFPEANLCDIKIKPLIIRLKQNKQSATFHIEYSNAYTEFFKCLKRQQLMLVLRLEAKGIVIHTIQKKETENITLKHNMYHNIIIE